MSWGILEVATAPVLQQSYGTPWTENLTKQIPDSWLTETENKYLFWDTECPWITMAGLNNFFKLHNEVKAMCI